MHECMNMHARMPTSLNCLSFCSTPSAIALYWSACCRAAFSWVCRPDDKMPANWAPLASSTPLHPKQKLTVVWLRTKFALPASTSSHNTIRPRCHRVLVKSQTCNQTLQTCSCAVSGKCVQKVSVVCVCCMYVLCVCVYACICVRVCTTVHCIYHSFPSQNKIKNWNMTASLFVSVLGTQPTMLLTQTRTWHGQTTQRQDQNWLFRCCFNCATSFLRSLTSSSAGTPEEKQQQWQWH